jgi:hypothetical protein
VSQLADHLTSESVKALHAAWKEGIEYLQSEKRSTLGFSRESYELVGEPMLRYVHSKLLLGAKWDPKAPDKEIPFKSRTSITQVIRDEIGVASEPAQRYIHNPLVGDISRHLKYAGLAYVGNGKQGVWVKPWTNETVPYVHSHVRVKVVPDPREEARIAAEANKPVNSKIDLRSFKVPDPDPEKVLDFIQRFVPAALKVQDRLVAVQAEVDDLRDQIDQLRVTQTNKQWEEVTKALQEQLKS